MNSGGYKCPGRFFQLAQPKGQQLQVTDLDMMASK